MVTAEEAQMVTQFMEYSSIHSQLEQFKLSCTFRWAIYDEGMRALSLDLRQRIVAAYDRGEGTQQQIAERFAVSPGMVKKLLKQRRRTGDLAARYHACHPPRKIEAKHRMQLRAQLAKKPDLTLAQLREAIGVDCTIQAIHYVLAEMGLTYKKRLSGPASKTAQT